MTNEYTPQFELKLLGTYAYLWTLYFVTVGSLYLWGYWSPFDVNVLEYLSVGDVVKTAAIPIASTFFFLALGVVMGEVTGSWKLLPPSKGRSLPLGRFLPKYAAVFRVIYAVVIVAIIVFGPSLKWYLVSALAAMPIMLLLDGRGFLSSVIPSERFKSVSVFLLAMLPFFAFAHGDWAAKQLLEGRKFQYVLSALEGVVVAAKPEPTNKPRFIGHAGDFVFFWDPAKSFLIISKFEDGKSLVLGRFSRSATPEIPATTPDTP